MAGGDIAVFKKAGNDAPEIIGGLIGLFHRIIRAIRGSMCRSWLACTAPPPAAAFGLALACDFVIASEDAAFVPAYTKLGTNPDGGTTWTVTRLLGPQRALEWLMLGEAKDARAAKDMGLVHHVVPKDALASEVDAWPAGSRAALPRPKPRSSASSIRPSTPPSTPNSMPSATDSFVPPATRGFS